MPSWVEAVFAFLFKYKPEVFSKGDLVFGTPKPVIMLLALGLLIGGPAVMTYAGVRGKSTRRDRWILSGLRVACLLVLVLCMFRPMLLLSEAIAERNFVAVLLDDSRSMAIADKDKQARGQYETSTFGADSALLKELRKKFQVRLFRIGASAERIESVKDMTFTDQQTHIGDAIERVRQELESVPVSGMILVSDGADNSAAPIGEQLLSLRARSIPVFTIGVGAERFAKDIEVRRVDAPHSVMRGTAITADILIRQRGYAGRVLPLIVEDDGKIVAKDSVTLPADGDVAPVRVSVFLNKPGARALAFRIPLQDGEQVTQNNAQVVLVDVRQRREKILYIEGEPRYEARFVRAAVAADSNLQLVMLQRTAEDKFLRLDVDNADELKAGFPKTRGELFAYRAIVLGSIEASSFTQDQMKMLAEFVSVRGGGLLFLGGRRAFAEGGYTGTPLSDVMPVQIEGPPVPDSVTFFAELKVSVTPLGKSSAVTQIAATTKKADDRWATLPTVTTVNYIRTKQKPGANAILMGETPEGARSGWPTQRLFPYQQPVLIAMRYGRGISMALPIQDSYSWQMDPKAPDEDIAFQTFWRQLLRWLTSDVPGQLQLSVPADQVMPGQSIAVRAMVTDTLYVPRNDAQVVMHVADSAAGKDLPMEWIVDRDGEYRASFTPKTAGLHVVRVEVTPPTGPTLRDSVVIRVGDLNAEYVDAEMRAPLLKRIADETGGKFYTPNHTSSLVQDLALSKNGVTTSKQMDLWDMPAIFLLLVMLVSAEWAYRKARGLA